jgi:leucyl-tRNA synthetase
MDDMSTFEPYDGKAALKGPERDLHRKTHQTIKKVSRDIEDRFHFNTAISAVMELVNEISKYLSNGGNKDWSVLREAVETTVVLLSPVVPHITEELWHLLGREESLLNVGWPSYREEALEVESRLVVLQVNGKVRDRIEVPTAYSEKDIEAEALKSQKVQNFVAGKPIKKVIVVQHKLVNVVV